VLAQWFIIALYSKYTIMIMRRQESYRVGSFGNIKNPIMPSIGILFHPIFLE